MNDPITAGQVMEWATATAKERGLGDVSDQYAFATGTLAAALSNLLNNPTAAERKMLIERITGGTNGQ
ncbi:MAG TPA: hypothetical protein VEH04_08240 [Verrucomicrobiae bacterium]|nr:hypothetical protein [Verrucomicrobiae bacterium]